jgi:hypothetical protein
LVFCPEDSLPAAPLVPGAGLAADQPDAAVTGAAARGDAQPLVPESVLAGAAVAVPEPARASLSSARADCLAAAVEEAASLAAAMARA